MKRLAKLTLLLSVPALLTACANGTAPTADMFCKSWREIDISKADVLTDKTASQIEGNNDARKSVGCKG